MTKAELIATLEEMKESANTRMERYAKLGPVADGAYNLALGEFNAYLWALQFAKMLED